MREVLLSHRDILQKLEQLEGRLTGHDEEIQAIVLAGGNAIQIAEAAQKAGVRDLRQSALMKARNGITSLAEINRVTKD